MPSFAAYLYGSALYTPGPSGVRCFVENCCEPRSMASKGESHRWSIALQGSTGCSHPALLVPHLCAWMRFHSGSTSPEIGRRTLPVGTSLIAQLHQERAQTPLHRPLVLIRKLLPPAPDLPLPERPSHPEEVLLNHFHRSLLYLHPQVPSHPLHRQPLGFGAPPSLSPHQILELDQHSPSFSLPPQELPVALIERLKLTSAQLSTPDGD